MRSLLSYFTPATDTDVLVATPAAPMNQTPAENQAISVPQLGPVTPLTSAAVADMSSAELAEYSAIAARVGIKSNGALIKERLQHCLIANAIEVYSSAAVCRYLDHHLGEWEWQGLRQEDVDQLNGWFFNHHGECQIMVSHKIYSGKIPLPVLLTIEKIQAGVPEVSFYISAPKHNDGDPFLLVSGRGMGSYIIERWDEPGFRDR